MGKKISLPTSSMTGKATTATARALGKTVADLEIDIRKLVAKKNKTAEEKAELAVLRRRLRDTKAELAEEAASAGRSIQQTARDRKMKDKVTMRESLDDVMARKAKEKEEAEFAAEEDRYIGAGPTRKAKGGMARKKYNKGGYANCGASMPATQKSTKMAYGGMARKR